MKKDHANANALLPRVRVDKRVALIDIGTMLFMQKGFSSTGVDEIVQAADVPKGSFYYYFASKEEFAIAVIESYDRYFSRKLERILADHSKTPLARLKAFTEEAADSMTRFDFKRGCLIGNLGQEMASLEEHFRVVLLGVLRDWRARFAACLQEAKDCGEIRTPVDAAVLSHFFWCAWEGAVLCAKLERSAASLDIVKNVFFCHTLEPVAPADAVAEVCAPTSPDLRSSTCSIHFKDTNVMFNALYLTKGSDNQTLAQVKQLDETELPEFAGGGVTITVSHSTINYKDGLAITGRSPVVRKYPMVPGIDFSGMVTHSEHPDWKPGDQVILNGWSVGEAHWGGLSQRVRVNGDWLIRRPDSLSASDAMAIGTAGYTAMLCVMALERNGVTAASGEVLVTGATGGVGSFAVTLLAARGFKVVASTGKKDQAAFLQGLGAGEIIDRDTLSRPGKPLQKERWAGVVDTVGSHTLANACASARYHGVVTACGLAQGMDFPVTVAPFILRAVNLVGIDSVMAPRPLRVEAWSRLAREVTRSSIESISHTVGLEEAIAVAPQILAGGIRGRVVVDVDR